MYNIKYRKPEPFSPREFHLSVPERMSFRGEVITPLDEIKARELARFLKKNKVDSIAVCFLHAYANPKHELRMRDIIKEEYPDADVTLSYDVLREYREFERASTTVLSAYVKPVVRRYLSSLKNTLQSRGFLGPLYVMNSSGGVMTAESAESHPILMIESSPAAGIIGAAELGKLIGCEDAITFDMGGTTVKASVVTNGTPVVAREYRIGKQHPIAISVLDIVELGAGGGSIAWIDEGGVLKVGPKSAGADPGPVCYGWGGAEPTVTDACLVLGWINPDYFWAGQLKLDTKAATAAIEERISCKLGMDVTQAASGIVKVVTSHMLLATRIVSIERGHNPRDFTMIAFGGGGPLFSPRIAAELGCRRLVIPFAPANFAAWGMLMTDIRYDRSQTYISRLDEAGPDSVEEMFRRLESESNTTLERDGVPPNNRRFIRKLNIRYRGQEHTIEVPVGENITASGLSSVEKAFDEIHEALYKHSAPAEPKEITGLRSTALGITEKPKPPLIEIGGKDSVHAVKGRREVFLGDTFERVTVYDRTKLLANNAVTGPALIEEATSTTVLLPGQSLVVDKHGNLIIELGGVR